MFLTCSVRIITQAATGVTGSLIPATNITTAILIDGVIGVGRLVSFVISCSLQSHIKSSLSNSTFMYFDENERLLC